MMVGTGRVFSHVAQLSTAVQAEETDTVSTVDTLETDTLPWPQSLCNRIDTLIARAELLQTSQLSMMVYDLTADSCLYAFQEHQTLRPASTMKTVTAITALDVLGGSYQFKTRLAYTGDIQNNDSSTILNGNVYLIGGMDPRIGRDDVTALVESLKNLGIDTIRGNICADRSMKDSTPYGEGWCWDDDNPVLSPLVYGRKDALLTKFIDEMKEQNIVCTGDTLTETCPSEGACEICSRSHSIDQILYRMLKNSDNLYAEAMFYNIAGTQGYPAKASGARKVIETLIRKIGLNPSRYRIADGSGLSLYNYVTTELEIRFLRYAYMNSVIYNHLYQALPVAAVDGTLSKRMHDTSAAGNVHAKTGTVTGVSSLAGYATASNGHILAFSIINQGVMHADNAKRFQDNVCVAMTK